LFDAVFRLQGCVPVPLLPEAVALPKCKVTVFSPNTPTFYACIFAPAFCTPLTAVSSIAELKKGGTPLKTCHLVCG